MFGVGKGLGQGILSLLQGLGKGGKQVISPATQARNMTGAGAGRMAKAAVAKDAMAKSRQVIDGLITRGQIPPERREEVMRKIMTEVAKNLQNATAPVDPNALAKKVLWVALGTGAAGGYGVGRNQEAIQEMLNAVQLPTGIDIETTPVGELFGAPEEAPEQTDSDLWGPKVAEGLMDTIWPFPRD